MASLSSSLLLLLVAILCSTFVATTVASTTNPDSLIISPATTIAQLVDAHNLAREAVGVPRLLWDGKLATFARGYAAERRSDCRLEHSPGFVYGENIFWGQGKRWEAKDVVAAWVDEKRWYHYGNNSCSSGRDCSHYTQIVWRTTEKLGCAKIVCNSNDTFVACEYFPPGNYAGARPY